MQRVVIICYLYYRRFGTTGRVPSSKVKNSKTKPDIRHVNDLNKEDEMGKACSMYGEEGKYVQGFGGEK
jgi:hypothetical protein